MQELTKEEQLVINCARVKMPPDLARQTENLCRKDLNWRRILYLSDRHGITPLVYHSLRDLKVNGHIGSDNMSYLREAYYANAVRNLKLYEQLKEILAAFDEAGIQTIVLKGAALAETVYENIALRAMGDIDLLVRFEDLDKADETLQALGYISNPGPPMRWYKNYHHHLAVYMHPERIVSVEVHHHIASPRHNVEILVDSLWSSALPMRIGTSQAYRLSAEDLLVHVCLHAAVNGMRAITFRQLCDVLETVREYGNKLNWDAIIQRCRDPIVAKNIHTMLYLVRGLFQDNKIPPDVLARTERLSLRTSTKRLESMTLARFLDSGYSPFDQILWLDRNRDRLRMISTILWIHFRRLQMEIFSLFSRSTTEVK